MVLDFWANTLWVDQLARAPSAFSHTSELTSLDQSHVRMAVRCSLSTVGWSAYLVKTKFSRLSHLCATLTSQMTALKVTWTRSNFYRTSMQNAHWNPTVTSTLVITSKIQAQTACVQHLWQEFFFNISVTCLLKRYRKAKMLSSLT